MSEVRLQVCGCLWKDLSGERQLALTQQQKEKRRREAGTGWGRRPVGERKQDLGEVLRIGDQVGVIGEVCGRGCGRGGWYYQEKEFQASWGVERIGWVMGLWGPGEGWSDPRDSRPCMQVEGSRGRGRAHLHAVACRSLSCTSQRREQGPGLLGSLPSKRCVGPFLAAADESSDKTIAAARHALRLRRPNSHSHCPTPVADRYKQATFDAYQRYTCDKPHLSLCICLTI
jgi:hypothetical protein